MIAHWLGQIIAMVRNRSNNSIHHVTIVFRILGANKIAIIDIYKYFHFVSYGTHTVHRYSFPANRKET